MKKEKKGKSLKKVKDNDKRSEMIKKFKKKWLIKGINTVILIAILIAIFILINWGMKKWDPTPVDITKSQDYTLTQESKERVKNVEQDVNIYFMNWDNVGNSDLAYYYGKLPEQYDLVKQYNKANSKINVQKVDSTKNLEISKKYNIGNEDYKVIIESGKNSRTLEAYDLVDGVSGNYITEQKITSAILNVTSKKTPKAYFLTGYTSFALNSQGLLSVFAEYLENEVLTYENLNILSTQKVPDDCDTLIIMTPEKDFEDLVSDAIISYIKKGGNILWFNGVYEEEKEFKNVNKVLAQYGVNKFEKGVVYETDSQNILLGYPTCFMPEIEESTVLKNVKISAGAIILNATKINIDEEKLEKLNVEETNLITSADTTYFTKNLTSDFNKKQDTKGSFVLGTQLVKTVKEAKEATDEAEAEEAVTSTLIIYGNDFFISDFPVQNGQYQIPLIDLANNKDVALNSLALLTNNDQEITIRKSYSDSQTTFTPTEQETTIIMIIIFAVPIIIIIAGVVVWVIRKRRN